MKKRHLYPKSSVCLLQIPDWTFLFFQIPDIQLENPAKKSWLEILQAESVERGQENIQWVSQLKDFVASPESWEMWGLNHTKGPLNQINTEGKRDHVASDSGNHCWSAHWGDSKFLSQVKSECWVTTPVWETHLDWCLCRGYSAEIRTDAGIWTDWPAMN